MTALFFKRMFLLCLLMSGINWAIGQVNFIPGQVVLLNGDTLSGYIDYRNWAINPKKVAFKTNIDSVIQILNPLEILEFSVSDEIYVSAVVKVETTPLAINNIEDDASLHFRTDTIFLQTLIKGAKSLFFYKNEESRDNYYIKEDSAIELLVYKQYIKKDENGHTYAAENNTYLGQLRLYLGDCPTIQSYLENTKYNKNSLISLFQEYYNCISSETAFMRKPEKVRCEAGMLVGSSLSTLRFQSTEFDYLVNATYSYSINFTRGAYLDFIIPRNQGRWSVYNEFLYTNYKVNGLYEFYHSKFNYGTVETEIGIAYVQLCHMLRFKVPVRNAFIYLNGGISNGIAYRFKNYKHEVSNFYSIIKDEEGFALDRIRPYEQSIILGMGLKYKKCSFEARYEMGNGMSSYSILNSTSTRYFLLFGYQFQ